VPTDAPYVDTAATRGVLAELLAERQRQVEVHGWTPAHDDWHTVSDFAWLIARRVVDLSNPSAAAALDARRLLVESAAIAIAAIERFDRL
jgi:predicted glycoside hydrolase/deacetylase ChbG (UPF0249 family)